MAMTSHTRLDISETAYKEIEERLRAVDQEHRLHAAGNDTLLYLDGVYLGNGGNTGIKVYLVHDGEILNKKSAPKSIAKKNKK
jgi:hypothetical protein